MIDPTKIILLNTGWMTSYKGPDGDSIFNGGWFPKTHGHGEAGESFNFQPWKGRMYGYAFAQKHHIDTRNLGATDKAQPANGVTVIFTALHPREYGTGTRIVGWYRNATVYPELREITAPAHIRQRSSKKYPDSWSDYIATCADRDAFLLPERDRPELDRTGIKSFRTIGYLRPGVPGLRNFVRQLEGLFENNPWVPPTIEEKALEGDVPVSYPSFI